MKEYIIDIVYKDAEYDGDNRIQGLFNHIGEAINIVKEKFVIDDIDYFVISENTVNGLDEVYDSRNNVIMKLDTLDECLDEYNKLIKQGRNVFWGRMPEGWFEITEE